MVNCKIWPLATAASAILCMAGIGLLIYLSATEAANITRTECQHILLEAKEQKCNQCVWVDEYVAPCSEVNCYSCTYNKTIPSINYFEVYTIISDKCRSINKTCELDRRTGGPFDPTILIVYIVLSMIAIIAGCFNIIATALSCWMQLTICWLDSKK